MKFSMTNKEYNQYVKKKSPNSPLLADCLRAFLVGGAICVIGQLLGTWYRTLPVSNLQAATLTSATMIFLGALLTGLNLYDDIARIGGAGTLVPITGFANSIVASAMEFKSEGYVLGLGAKMFTIAGPVIVFGVTASVIYGVIYWLMM